MPRGRYHGEVSEQLTLWRGGDADWRPPAEGRPGRHEWIEAILRQRLGPRVVVSLTDNRSTMISSRTRRDVLYVRIHRAFTAAPLPVLEAVACYLGGGRLTTRRAQLIDRFVDGITASRPPRRPRTIHAEGRVHDLSALFDRVNRLFFRMESRASITWSGPKTSRARRPRASIRLGSYCDDLKLVRIHRALDQAFVPEYFVETVVHHEMLHERHGMARSADGRRIIHSAAFRAEERRHPDYARARAWERKHLPRLLRSSW